MKADAQIETQVNSSLTAFAEAYAARDLERVMKRFAGDPDVVLYGTGADEKRVGPEAIRFQTRRDWEQTDSIAIRFDSIAISAAGPVAWAAVDGAFEFSAGGESGTLPTRITFVLEERDGDWLIVHSHFSLPAAGQPEGRSI
jgi:uncharacterized protein (TIGR02246 family)